MNTNAVDALYTEKVLMHGPSFDGSGEIVERKVVRADVTAYRNAGYENGPNPVKTIAEAVEAARSVFVYTKAAAIAQNEGLDESTAAQEATKKGRRGKG